MKLIAVMSLAFQLISGCSVKPTPLQNGAETSPPYGCIEYRKRGGDC